MNKNFLEVRRKELGLTLQEVADIVGVSKSTVLRWETGDIFNMKRDKILLYSQALKISPLYFVVDDYVEDDVQGCKSEILDALDGLDINTMGKVLNYVKKAKSK